MFLGLFLNTLYPHVNKPLSTFPALVSLNISIGLLLMAFAIMNRNADYSFRNVLGNINLSFKHLFSPQILPMLLPFLAIIGTHLMNTYHNNTLLITLLILIPASFSSIILYWKKISTDIIPFVIWSIAISLLLMHGLSCDYITGSDIHEEHYTFQITNYFNHWDIGNWLHGYNTCLSLTVFPTLIASISGLNGLQIFKIVFQLIFSFAPVMLYFVYKRFIGSCFSFIASIFFISQYTFIYEMVEHCRQEIALFFFILLILTIFSTDINKFQRQMLVLIFGFCTILSHYTTGYIFLTLLLLTGLILNSLKVLKIKSSFRISSLHIIVFAVLTILWYGIITGIPFKLGVDLASNMVSHMSDLFLLDTRDSRSLSSLGINMQQGIPYSARFWVRNATYLFIAIGSISILKGVCKRRAPVEYVIMMTISAGLVLGMLILPYIAEGYGMTRLFLQALIFLALCFPIGVFALSKHLNNLFGSKISAKRIFLFIVISVLVLQNVCATTLIFNIFGTPHALDLNDAGTLRESLYITESEIEGASWVANYTSRGSIIMCDVPGRQRILLGYTMIKSFMQIPPKIKSSYFETQTSTDNGYLYLRATNINNGKVSPKSIYPNDEEIKDLSDYLTLFMDMNKIYSNSGSEVYV